MQSPDSCCSTRCSDRLARLLRVNRNFHPRVCLFVRPHRWFAWQCWRRRVDSSRIVFIGKTKSLFSGNKGDQPLSVYQAYRAIEDFLFLRTFRGFVTAELAIQTSLLPRRTNLVNSSQSYQVSIITYLPVPLQTTMRIRTYVLLAT